MIKSFDSVTCVIFVSILPNAITANVSQTFFPLHYIYLSIYIYIVYIKSHIIPLQYSAETLATFSLPPGLTYPVQIPAGVTLQTASGMK